MAKMLIDIHSHIDICRNIPEILENAKKHNVKILTAGINQESNRKILELKEKFSGIELCLGIYPTEALKLSEKQINSEIEFIRKNKNKLSAIGEIGLDLKENSEETLEKQKENLKRFVLLAKEINIPAIIHSRKAEEECVEFLERLGYKKIIMHCFSGNMELVDKIIKNNWFLSIPANAKYSQHFQKIIEITPTENLFCETDSPYLHPDRKFPNEPANVSESYKKIAEIKKISLSEAEKKIAENYKKIFGGGFL